MPCRSKTNPRGHRSRKDPEHFNLVNDPDHPAGARAHDHPPVVHNRITILGVAGNRPQFDGWRQRLAHHDSLPNGHRRGAFALDRPDHGVRDLHRRANGGAQTISPTGPATSPPVLAPFTAPVAVVDWAKAALEANNETAINETASFLFITSSNEFTTAPTDGPQELFRGRIQFHREPVRATNAK